MRRLLPFALIFGACDCGDGPQLGKVTPELALDTDRVDFGQVPLGATKRVTLLVRNAGTANLELAAVDTQQPFAAEVVEAVILPGQAGAIELAFTPVNDEPATGTLTIVSNDPASPAQVVLTGLGVEGAVTLRPSIIDLSNTAVGTARVQEIVLSNLGIEAVTGNIVTERFSRPEHFSLSALASFAVPGTFAIGPRSDLILDLEYRPFELGDDSGRIIFEICGERCGLEVQVVASGAQPIVQIMPPLLDFGGVGIGQAKTQQAVVANLGTRPVLLTSVTTAGGPELEVMPQRSIPTELGAGQSLGINVVFTPESAVEFAGEVIVETTDPLAPSVRASVIGRGEGPLFVVQPEAINFGVRREMITHRRSLLLINAGSSDVTVQTVSLSGAPELAIDRMPGLPARIGSGQSITVELTFTPAAIGEYLGTVSITSDDPARPQVEVPVIAGLTDRLCELEYRPDRVNFGLIPPTFVRRKSTTLTNAGDDDCMLASGSFRAPIDPYFSLVGAPFPALVPVGGSITLDFEYAPAMAVESKGNFVILTDDPVFPERHVTLLGSAAGYVDVFTEPTSVDFGAVRPGCSSGAREIKLFNAGTVGVEVSSIVLTSSTTELAMSRVPATPFNLRAGTVSAFDVSYTPVDLGSEEGLVEIAIRDLPFPLVVPLRGEGSDTPRIEDRFQQTETRAVDVLFVIDNSCSMAEEQAALVSNFARFIQQASLRRVDFQIGITTTTLFPNGGTLVGPILTSSTRNLEAAFTAQANVGINGSGVEQGLEAMQSAISLSARGVPPNAGLFRPDAGMAIIIVSDEDDQSLQSPVTYFNDLRNAAINGYTTAVITGGAAGCQSATGIAVPAPRYLEFAMLTGGLSESICTSWASTLTNIGNAAFGLRTVFHLSQNVDQNEPIEVRVNGSSVPESEWMFDPQSRAIIFTDPPPEGADIEIEYTPAC